MERQTKQSIRTIQNKKAIFMIMIGEQQKKNKQRQNPLYSNLIFMIFNNFAIAWDNVAWVMLDKKMFAGWCVGNKLEGYDQFLFYWLIEIWFK